MRPCALLLLAVGGDLGAQEPADPPAFDRPGIGFGTEVLARGVVAWEQGLPSVSVDRQEGARSTQYTLDSLWRIGLGANLELQLGADSYHWTRGAGRAQGGGDARVGFKLALPSSWSGFGWALQGGYGFPTGSAAFSAGEHVRDLGLAASWDLPGGRGFALYANLDDAHSGRTWTFSPNYTFYSDDRIGGYVELGYSHGEDDSQVGGTGLTWQVHDRLQLDAFVLRGLNSAAPDWQAGLGFALAFD